MDGSIKQQDGKAGMQAEWERLVDASIAKDYGEVATFLDSEFADVRGSAAFRIRKARWAPAAAALQRRLQVERDAEVRTSLVGALASVRRTAAAETLASLLDDDEEVIRRLALRGLSLLNDPRVPELARSFYTSGDGRERIEALDALVRLDAPEAESCLQSLLDNERQWFRRRALKKALRLKSKARRS